VLATGFGQLVDDLVRPRVLPVDLVMDRLAGRALPHDRRLALVRDADRHQVRDRQLRLVERALHDLLDVAPDLLRVVLDPTRPGKDLLVLLLGDRDEPGRAIEYETTGRGGALVDRGHELLAHLVLILLPRDRPELPGHGASSLTDIGQQIGARLSRREQALGR